VESGLSISAKILVVDDLQLVRHTLRSLLAQQDNWEVHEAANGQRALERISEIKPDVVVLDVVMPEMNGLRAADEIFRLVPKTKIIFMSSHYVPPQGSLIAQLFGDGVFIQKSEIGRELVPAISRLVSAHSTHLAG
jgi:DNA-binding NarL/FixJ family response regulator